MRAMTDSTSTHTILNPDGLHDPTPMGYSHTARVPTGTELVMIAGQYGSDGHGAVVSTEFAEQVRRAFDNLRVALAAHGLGPSDVVQLRTYIVDHDLEKLGAAGEVMQGIWGAHPPLNTLLGVAALALPDMYFEVEAIATRPTPDPDG